MIEYEYRWYQEDCEDALLMSVLKNPENHPVAAVPTGAGKSKILGSFISKFLERRPEANVLVLSHTEEILKQDYVAILSFFPGIPLGLYSSGLGCRYIKKITVAGIQSVYKQADRFKHFDIIIIDEAHSIPTKGKGMYRQFLKKVPALRIGLTATHFRTGHGYIHEGEGALFNNLVYDLSSRDNFNRLVDEGYLANLISKSTEFELDTSNVKMSGGDFSVKDLSVTLDRNEITKNAVEELVKFGSNYKKWLVFAIDIQHANNIAEKLREHDIDTEYLHSKMSKSRDEVVARYKFGKTRALVSVGMVTTGFDAPNIDLIALLRPTRSLVLHVQMIGRGLRTCKGKSHCLVLDFAGNTERLGPINAIEVPHKGKKKKNGGSIITKRCPSCGVIHFPLIKVCNVCGHEFIFKEKLKTTASHVEVVQKSLPPKVPPKWLNVDQVVYTIHEKRTSPPSLKVTYLCGVSRVNEWVCYEHSGYAKHLANYWVKMRLKGESPNSTDDLYRMRHQLRVPSKILVDVSGKFLSIKNSIFE